MPSPDGASIRATQLKEVPREEAEPESNLDPLEELLHMDGPGEITDTVDMRPRYTMPWTVKALDNKLNDRLIEEATVYKKNPRTGQQVRELNTGEYARLIVFHCVVKPNLRDPRVAKMAKVEQHQHVRIVDSVLPLPGYVERVSQKIMELSGFSDQLVEVGKDSSNKVG